MRATRIVAHRGEHDGNRTVRENTLAAFGQCLAAGVWGIELDIQWTRERHPVVLHDADAARVFGRPLRIDECDYAELNRACPEIPGLEDVVAAFGTRLHLMLELKVETWRPGCADILAAHLRDLEPARDYHLLSLDPELFAAFDRFPPDCFLPVAQVNTRRLFDLALRRGYGGLTGHYVLLDRAMRHTLSSRGLKWGTGFIASRNALLRELGSGTHWVFSDRAVALQRYVDSVVAGLPSE
jgi:glycerophosphoryl diester phosphodiesterase